MTKGRVGFGLQSETVVLITVCTDSFDLSCVDNHYHLHCALPPPVAIGFKFCIYYQSQTITIVALFVPESAFLDVKRAGSSSRHPLCNVSSTRKERPTTHKQWKHKPPSHQAAGCQNRRQWSGLVTLMNLKFRRYRNTLHPVNASGWSG